MCKNSLAERLSGLQAHTVQATNAMTAKGLVDVGWRVRLAGQRTSMQVRAEEEDWS